MGIPFRGYWKTILKTPGVRYFVLRELLDTKHDDGEVLAAREAIMAHGPVPVILEAQDYVGYWVEPGPGYYPKYRRTVWQIISLAQLSADGHDLRIKAACDYILEHTRSRYGGISYDTKPSEMIQCLQGNLGAALIDLGWMGDERLMESLDWLARSITGEGIEPAENKSAPVRYYRSGNSGPGFPCSANNHLPCAWGAVKSMLALSKVPELDRPPQIRSAIDEGVRFLFSRDPALADYPMGYRPKPNRSWFKFGFHISYVTDVLQNLEALTSLGYGQDARLQPALELLLSKQDNLGRRKMGYTYNGKTWVDIEQKGEPSKWVTLRALRVLKRADGS
ncbi:nitrogen fixation protein NifH [Chloroflexota bacterium]